MGVPKGSKDSLVYTFPPKFTTISNILIIIDLDVVDLLKVYIKMSSFRPVI